MTRAALDNVGVGDAFALGDLAVALAGGEQGEVARLASSQGRFESWVPRFVWLSSEPGQRCTSGYLLRPPRTQQLGSPIAAISKSPGAGIAHDRKPIACLPLLGCRATWAPTIATLRGSSGFEVAVDTLALRSSGTVRQTRQGYGNPRSLPCGDMHLDARQRRGSLPHVDLDALLAVHEEAELLVVKPFRVAKFPRRNRSTRYVLEAGPALASKREDHPLTRIHEVSFEANGEAHPLN